MPSATSERPKLAAPTVRVTSRALFSSGGRATVSVVAPLHAALAVRSMRLSESESCRAGPRRVILGLAASGAATSIIPAGHGALGYTRATSAALGSVSSRIWCNCWSVQRAPGISPRESHRRITAGVTLHAAAARRTEDSLRQSVVLLEDDDTG
jgi:hypothetical protein